jgi:hypothetical protein
MEPALGSPLAPPVRTAANVEHGAAGIRQRPKGPAAKPTTIPDKGKPVKKAPPKPGAKSKAAAARPRHR